MYKDVYMFYAYLWVMYCKCLLNSGTSMFQGNITYYTRIVFVV